MIGNQKKKKTKKCDSLKMVSPQSLQIYSIHSDAEKCHKSLHIPICIYTKIGMLISIYIFLRRVFIQCYLKYPLLLSSYPLLENKATHSLLRPTLIRSSFMKSSWVSLGRRETSSLL